MKKIFGGEDPKLSPEVPGKWTTKNLHTIVFTPSGFGAPLAAELKVELPEKLGIVQSDGSTDEATTVGWEVPAGSEMRLQQLLAGLGYLPWKFDGEEVAKTPEAQIAAATTEVPKGHFSPRWGNMPSGLKELWTPGEENVLVKGALMSFEERNGFEVDGLAGPVVWEALMKATIAGEVKPEDGAANGYTYVWVNKTEPETVNVWHNGKMILSEAPANTGIPGAETEDGTFPVYLRYEETTMSGENPDGSKYNDPGIKWVSYFNGGDALHAVRPRLLRQPAEPRLRRDAERRGRSDLALHADRHPGHDQPGLAGTRVGPASGRGEEVDRAGAREFVGAALGLDHVPVDDDRAVPMARRAGQLRDRLARLWPVDLDPTRGRFVDVERGRRRRSGWSPA